MNIPDWLQRQEQALLELITADSTRQCGLALEDARRRAATVLGQARSEARTHMRQVFAEQRQQRAERLAAAQARMATARRLHQQQQLGALLQLAWAQLPGELHALWREPASRQRWVQQVLASALARMPGGGWQVQHAPDWPEDERRAAAATLPADGPAPVFMPDPRIAAGLKVLAQGNAIDGTLAGLLAERADFEARLLRLLENEG